MAHHKSAQKRIRQTERRTTVNRARKAKTKTATKELDAAIASGSKEKAQAALKAVQSRLSKNVSKGVGTKRLVARKVSRLNAKVKALSTKK